MGERAKVSKEKAKVSAEAGKDPFAAKPVVSDQTGYVARGSPPHQDPSHERDHAATPWRPKGRR